MQFLKVPNAVLDYHLPPNALKVYLFLCLCADNQGTATVRLGVLQKRCAIQSPATVRASLAELKDRGLVSSVRRCGRGGWDLANRFSVQKPKGPWFRLWLDCAPFELLDKSAFCVYAYLCRQRIAYSGKACPSQSGIARAIGLARRTVNDAIQRLSGLGLLIKGALWRGKHNLYVVMQRCTATAITKKEMPPLPLTAMSAGHLVGHKPKFNIGDCWQIVKAFFLAVITCAIFNPHYLDLTFTPKRKKKYSLRNNRYRDSNNKGGSVPAPPKQKAQSRCGSPPLYFFEARNKRREKYQNGKNLFGVQ